MNTTKSTVCPVVAEEDVEFVEGVLVGGSYTMVPFTRRIAWVRESETEYVYRHRGHRVTKEATLNDWYGFLQSFSLEDVDNWLARVEVLLFEAFTLDADLVIHEVPVLAGGKVERGRREFQVPGDGWRLAKVHRGLPEGSKIRPVPVVTRDVFFTTGKHNPADPPPELLDEIEGWRREAAKLAGGAS